MIVIKGNATLDYATPLLWKISTLEKNAKISVLYCSMSRSNILKNASFYSNVFKHCNISEYDFLDFLQGPFSFLKSTFRALLSESNWDIVGWKRLLIKLPISNRIINRIAMSLNNLDLMLSEKVNFKDILPGFDPDIVLFDNRTSTNFHGRKEFYHYFAQQKRKIVLLPHAPLHSGTYSMIPFDEKGETLPKYCDYWMPYKYERTSELMPDQKGQFAYVGYPGMDSEWLNWVRSQNLLNKKCGNKTNDRPLKCLFVIRKFRSESVVRNSSDQEYIFDYDEFINYVNIVKKTQQEINRDITIIVKPHPSNNISALTKVFSDTGVRDWEITQDSIYSTLNEIDIVISMYSTAPFIPAMSGIPVIWLNSRLQSIAHRDDMKPELFTGFQHFLDNPDDLTFRMKKIVDSLEENNNNINSPDIVHLRDFYPEGSIEKCLGSLDF